MPASWSRASVAAPMPLSSRKLASDPFIPDPPVTDAGAGLLGVLDLDVRALVETDHVEPGRGQVAVEEHRDDELVDAADVAARVAFLQGEGRDVERDRVVGD